MSGAGRGVCVLLLEESQAWLLAEHPAPLVLPWSAGSADALVRAAQRSAPEARAVVLVVGGAFLECARPQLPDAAAAMQRRALHFQADRFFAAPGPHALAVAGETAMAADATWLRTVRDACARWTTVRAVTSLPQAALLANVRGSWQASAGRGEHLAARLDGDRLTELRRARGSAPAGVPALDVPAVLQAVRQVAAAAWTADWQLLDLAGEEALATAGRRAWWRAALVGAAAVAALAWSAEQWRNRELAATRAAITRLDRDAAPAQEAEARMRRAGEEAALIRAAAGAAARADAPSQVLARLGALLPKDAFVQRLDWDGSQWRIDGSATDAAALVPRLDADPEIEAVRSLAPSTRFFENGVPRSSFSIGFRLRGAPPSDGASSDGASSNGAPRGGS
jgi:hypothetical protein